VLAAGLLEGCGLGERSRGAAMVGCSVGAPALCWLDRRRGSRRCQRKTPPHRMAMLLYPAAAGRWASGTCAMNEGPQRDPRPDHFGDLSNFAGCLSRMQQGRPMVLRPGNGKQAGAVLTRTGPPVMGTSWTGRRGPTGVKIDGIRAGPVSANKPVAASGAPHEVLLWPAKSPCRAERGDLAAITAPRGSLAH
jgi:hypothetical protein